MPSGVIIISGEQRDRIYATCLSYSSTFRLVKECERRGFGRACALKHIPAGHTRWAINPKTLRKKRR